MYNEETCIPKLLRRLAEVSQQNQDFLFEAVFVNDGSSDGSRSLLMQTLLPFHAKIVSFSRNFGHQAAIRAGLTYADGDCTIIMDADLQDEPEIILQLLKLFQEGFDVVNVVRKCRLNTPPIDTLLYKFYYKVLAVFSSTPITQDCGDFCLISKRVVKQLSALPEYHVFWRGLRSWVGFRQTSISVERPARHAGVSKYTFLKLVSLASSGLFSFSTIPIRFVTSLGIAISLLGAAFATYAIVLKVFLQGSPTGFTALVCLSTFLSGTIIFSLGVVGEYVGRIYEEVKRRPSYIVESLVEKPASLR